LKNNIWVCGNNKHGQLGLGDNVNRKILTKIPNIKAKEIFCGYNVVGMLLI
jgi:alpha-tubulin suppressor-like RCC1 family protein